MGPAALAPNQTPAELHKNTHVLLVGGFTKHDAAALTNALPSSMVCQRLVAEGSLSARYTHTSEQVFTYLRTLLESKPRTAVAVQVIVHGQATCFAGLSGLLKTARQENPQLLTQCISLDSVVDPATLRDIVVSNAQALDAHVVRYRTGQREVERLHDLAMASDSTADKPWKDTGVYLISGGLGGLGLVFAKDIAAHTANATVILSGRSALTAEHQAILDTLAAAGLTVEYHQADVADRAAVDQLIADIHGTHGALNGIIHSAGIINDNFILKKSTAELQQVLAPKVAGLIHLDEATQQQALDLFICFSSTSGAFGNPGQADYAAANAFMDQYAQYRQNLVATGQRHGKTLSISWPLWAEGGMHVDVAVQAAMATKGLHLLPTAEGLAALHHSLQGDSSHVIVMYGDVNRLKELKRERDSSVVCADAVDSDVDIAQVTRLTLEQLRKLFSETSKLAVERVDVDESFANYGIDSILITQLNQQLEAAFGELSKTLFYEYDTLASLCDYLVTAYTTACMRWTGLHAAVSHSPSRAVMEEKQVRRILRKRLRHEEVSAIAIIGLAGRYPQANTLDAYWENLKSGKDCIGEIPAERWALEDFYVADSETAIAQGKSYSKWGGFVDGFDEFDPLFFGISPREAENMDPQERLFLISCWEALEDAGYTRAHLYAKHQGRIGVYAGITKTGFDLYGPALWTQGNDAFPHTSFSSVANRVSYQFNFSGPSMPIDTMCSASLTALHEACEHLKRGECEVAIAGGVNLYLHPSNYVALCKQRMLSSDGQCKSFGENGNGFVPGRVWERSCSNRLAKPKRIGITSMALSKALPSTTAAKPTVIPCQAPMPMPS